MVFSSHLFIFYFLPLVLLIYYAMPRRGKHVILTLLSYIFYGWANPYFVFLMFFSTVVDYICGLAMTHQFGKAWKEPVFRPTPGIWKVVMSVWGMPKKPS